MQSIATKGAAGRSPAILPPLLRGRCRRQAAEGAVNRSGRKFSEKYKRPCAPYDDSPRIGAIRKFLYRLYEIDDNAELNQEEVDVVYKWLYNCRMDELGYGLVKDLLVRGRKLNRAEKMKLTGILFDEQRIRPMMQEHRNRKHIQTAVYHMHRLQDMQIAECAMKYLLMLTEHAEQVQNTSEHAEGRVK